MSLEKVTAYFDKYGLKDRVKIFNQSSATVELAAEALGVKEDEIAKTMSFLLHDQPIVIVMSGQARIDNHKYKETFHVKAKMVPFEEVEEIIGHAPGGVCPFGIHAGVPVYMDDKINKRRKGMGLIGTLVTLFIMLKLAKVVSWSWFWVFSPIWITIIIAIVLFSSILVTGRVKKGQW